ncbi:melanosome assembly [Mactra antiquata]
MADKGRQMDIVFFIYDHNVLKKEEDDLKDAILFFSPSSYSIDERCALCGQLMGMTEFLSATICKSPPNVFRFEHDKYVFLHPGTYSLGMRGGPFIADNLLHKQLEMLYQTFVTYHGTIDSLKLRFKETSGGFLQELDNIWCTILKASGIIYGPSFTHTFQSLSYVSLPKTGSHLFLQASHLLQSSQRRPYVLAGTILYKNKVLSTQLPPNLTRHLTYLQNQIPHIVRKTDCDLPKGCRIITIFLTDEDLVDIDPLDSLGRRHCKVTDFSMKRETEVAKQHTPVSSKPQKHLTRRLTCPNISTPVSKQAIKTLNPKALQSFIVHDKNMESRVVAKDQLSVENSSWSLSKSPKMSLSHLPIVECKTGESHGDSEEEINSLRTSEPHFDRKFQQVDVPLDLGNEMSESESESETMTSPSEDTVFSEYKESNVKDLSKSLENEGNEVVNDQSNSNEVSNELNTTVSNKDENESNEHHNETVLEGPTDDISSIDRTNSKESLAKKDKNVTELDLTDGGLSVENDVQKSMKNVDNSSIIDKDKGNGNTDELGPSISDMEESDVDEDDKVDKSGEECLTEGVNSNSTNSVSIEENLYIEASSEKDDSFNSNSFKQDSSDLPVSEPRLLLSMSSDENTQMRSYDKLPTDQSETLSKGSNHSVYEHHVDVHADSLGNSLNEETAVIKKSLEVKENTQAVIKDDFATSANDGKSSTNGIAGKLPEKKTTLNELDDTKNVEKKSEIYSTSDVGSRLAEEITTDTKLEIHSATKYAENQSGGNDNIDIVKVPNKLISRTANRYESECETDDEHVAIATTDENVALAAIEPCINCLDLMAKHAVNMKGQSNVRCSQCISDIKQQTVFGSLGTDREVIDFGDTGQERHYESGAETDGGINVYNEKATPKVKVEESSSLISSLSSDISTNSTISQYWTHEMDGLNDLTLYVQCHSDISLLLLMENPDHYEENLFHSLWKGSLAYLADLDFYIKECTDTSDDDDDDNNSNNNGAYGFMKYDSISAELKGTICDPKNDKKSQNLHQMLTTMHSEFQQKHCLSDLTLRSNFNSCYGHSTAVEETYFQPELQQKLSSGFPIPRDPVFNLDVVAKQYLSKDKHLSLI